ncbi:MAG: acyl carrier protein [Simkaniaceae bacterium]|nr:acyl carrier protein [Simkaniaceae bacterium]
MSVEQLVIDVIVHQLGLDREEVSAEKSFVEDLNADSLDLTELIMTFEEKFGLEVSEGETERLRTVGDIIKFIEEKKDGAIGEKKDDSATHC